MIVIKVSDHMIHCEDPRHADMILKLIEKNSTVVIDFTDTQTMTPTFATSLLLGIRNNNVKARLTNLKVHQRITLDRSIDAIKLRK